MPARVDGRDGHAVGAPAAELQHEAARVRLPDDGGVTHDAVAGERRIAGRCRAPGERDPAAAVADDLHAGHPPGPAEGHLAAHFRPAALTAVETSARLHREGGHAPGRDPQHERAARRLPDGAPGALHAIGDAGAGTGRRLPRQARARPADSRQAQVARSLPGASVRRSWRRGRGHGRTDGRERERKQRECETYRPHRVGPGRTMPSRPICGKACQCP